MKDICFLGIYQPGQRNDLADAKKARRHIRKAVLRERGHRNIQSKVRHFTGARFVTTTPGIDHEATVRAQISEKTAHATDESRMLPKPSCQRLEHIPLQSVDLGTQQHLSPSPYGPWTYIHHPYTLHAASVVPLSTETIDSLFKSRFFRNAAEPLFDCGHVDSALCMNVVFPECFTCPAFLSALLYSIVQMVNRGHTTLEGLSLLGKALNCLRRSVASGQGLRHSQVGAIMILQGVAYRWNDVASHTTHTRGLIYCLQHSGLQEPCLTPRGARALFWQDLFAALLINSNRRHGDLSPPQFRWQRELRPRLPPTLPIGFLAHRDVLSDELVDCIEDIVELQTTVSRMKASCIDRETLSRMQASIESRLASQVPVCGSFSPIAECCRIAALIVCFLSFMDIWANALIPCRLSDLLRARLYDCMGSSEWVERRDLQIWLILTGAAVTSLDNGCVDNLTKKWHDLLTGFRVQWSEISPDGADEVRKALTTFIYCDTIVQRRSMLEWLDLPRSLSPLWPEAFDYRETAPTRSSFQSISSPID